MFLPTPTSKAGNSRWRKREDGVLQSENSSSPQSGFNYHEQPFLLLLLFPPWKQARRQAAAQVKGSMAGRAAGRGADNGGVIHYKGVRTYIHAHTHARSALPAATWAGGTP